METTNQNYLDQYLSDLLKKSDSDKLPSEYQLALKAELLLEIEKRLRLVSLEKLENRDQNRFAELLASKPSLAEQVKFFNSHIKNYQELMVKTLDEVSQEYLNNIKKLG